MNSFKQPYEISIWDDIWDPQREKFVERKSFVIGADGMESQLRVLEPKLIEKTNGTKTFSFKMYKRYTDSITGEVVDNHYVRELTSERKVKLKVADKWYDFFVKNIREEALTHLVSYELEDAIVCELSKNGFGVVLNREVIDKNGFSNIGTAKQLAEKVLAETDWVVSEDSEVFVQKIDESLVYLQTGKESLVATKLLDQTNLSMGIIEQPNTIIPPYSTILAFYSSCSTKPHRFQFIYLETGYKELKKDEERRITETNCQYYIDFDNPNNDYNMGPDAQYGLFLPKNFAFCTKLPENETSGLDTIISSWYRGERYGYSQQSTYLPQIDKYVSLYEKDGEKYYGYLNKKYYSPELSQNLISSPDFKTTSGWVGTKKNGTSASNARIERVVGYFENGVFMHISNAFINGNVDLNQEYETYLRVYFPSLDSLVINSGPYDKRTYLSNIDAGDEFVAKYSCLSGAGRPIENPFHLSLGEYKYLASGGYALRDGLTFAETEEIESNQAAFIAQNTPYSNETFKKKMSVRLAISPASMEWIGKYIYIKEIELFRAIRNSSGKLIAPNSTADEIEDLTIESDYYYFKEDAVKDVLNIDQLIPTERTKTLTYETYKPLYNTGAEKVRAVEAKESNYFNILQSIAETFGAWLRFNIERDDTGAITKKTVSFKNYIGKDNYAGFRYGVNLSGIQRTFESKSLVTKLIVKQNSNELAEDGFCTISRAGSNPLGENYIFDFSYFHKTGLLNAEEYLELTHVIDGAAGPDIEESVGMNIKGYFPRIRRLNQKYETTNRIYSGLSQDLVSVRADLELAEAENAAALYGIEDVKERYYLLLGKELGVQKITRSTAERSDVRELLEQYTTYSQKEKETTKNLQILREKLTKLEEKHNRLNQELMEILDIKGKLNQLFYSRYSRFIQEGTWLSEDYVDNELYYIDAQSVAYNSCHPKVAYQIKVLEVSSLPGLEGFVFDLGDKTFVEDKDFFGEKGREDVVVTEIIKFLDSPEKTEIKVQNFKNQFQDLFQRITATVQQAQYSEGSYEKAVALAEAKQERKYRFLSDALDSAAARLTTAGQQSVTWGNDGITITNQDSPCDSIRMIGGAILLSKQDKNGEQQWVTGVTSDGVSASMVTTGILNAEKVCIMNGNEPLFKWDAFGLNAYDAVEYEDVISGVNSRKFVRFDKNGIYGVNKLGIDGASWKPDSLEEIDNNATFSLTWEGLKVTGKDNTIARIGKQTWNAGTVERPDLREAIIRVSNKEKDTFCVDGEGNVNLSGILTGSKITGSEIIGSIIRNEKGSFSVDDNGNISGATVSGSTIIGSTIRNQSGTFSISSAGSIVGAAISTGKNFSVNQVGVLTATDANIEGKLTATGGEIRGQLKVTGSIGLGEGVNGSFNGIKITESLISGTSAWFGQVRVGNWAGFWGSGSNAPSGHVMHWQEKSDPVDFNYDYFICFTKSGLERHHCLQGQKGTHTAASWSDIIAGINWLKEQKHI